MAIAWSEALGVSLGALRANRIRSFLTMLGIIIGVGAVITMIALGQGAKKAVQDRIESLGANLLFVRPGAPFRGGVRFESGSNVRLTDKDVEAIQTKVRGLEIMVPETGRRAQVKYGNQNWNTQVSGTIPEYQFVRNSPCMVGNYFTKNDVATRQRVAVLGHEVWNNLFNGQDPVGKEVRINNISFTVVGLLAEKGQAMMFNQDDQILIPITTAQKRLFGIDFLTNVNVKVADEAVMEQAALDIEQVLRRQHRLKPGEENDFNIRSQADILSTLSETSQTFTTLLASIALVSLLVGGIGIMNIMLVSVTERTREIGTRIAIGAKKRDIMNQFLIEALLLSLCGGAIGAAAGIGGSVLLSKLANWNTLISVSSIFLAFLFSAAVGIFFGLYPARKAARLNPIEALRYE